MKLERVSDVKVEIKVDFFEILPDPIESIVITLVGILGGYIGHHIALFLK